MWTFLGKLNAAKESEFRRQRLSGSDMTREEFMRASVLSARERRSIERGWNRRDKKLQKAFNMHGAYLSKRISDLTTRMDANNNHVLRIERALPRQQLASLLVPLPSAGMEGGEGEGGEQREEISATQTARLWFQGYSVLGVLKAERERDVKQLGLLQAARQLTEQPLTTKAAVKAADSQRWSLLDEASTLRHDHSLLRIGADVQASGTQHYAVSTILRWVRDFRKHGGFRRDSRGVHEGDWILSEEDLQGVLVRWMKAQKRLSVKDVCAFINQKLFADEGGDLARLHSYQVTLPVSLFTAHSWMIKLGCQYERATKSFYTDGHERKDVVEYRGEYIQMRRKLALRQNVWTQLRKASLSPTELERIEHFKGANPEGDDYAEKVLQGLPDFKTEKTALQYIIESRGHILLLSPKCHPEVAGVGIKYSWGFSKQRFRRTYNDEVPKHLHANIEKSMCREKHLTIGRVRRFARRTRDYCRAYRDLLLGGGGCQG
ncbi:unnamed protein product [Hapterophycus canaliculatus]